MLKGLEYFCAERLRAGTAQPGEEEAQDGVGKEGVGNLIIIIS